MCVRNLILTAAMATAAVASHAAMPACGLTDTPLSINAQPVNNVRMALRGDSRPVLAVTDAVHNAASLYFYSCANSQCSTGRVHVIDTSTNYFGVSGIVVRADGRPAIVASYYGGLYFYDCADSDCSAYAIVVLRPIQSAILSDNPMILQANGAPAVLYLDGSISQRPNYVILHLCADVSCSSGTEKVLAQPPTSDSMISGLQLAIGSNGAPVATYLVSRGASNVNDYWMASCDDSACANVVRTPLAAPATGSIPNATALAVRSNQRPLALDSQSAHLSLLDCVDSTCTGATDRPLPALGGSLPFGLDLMSGDFPAFALHAPNSVGVFACNDATCSSGTTVQTASASTLVLDADFKVAADGTPGFAYVDRITQALAFAGCPGQTIFSDGFN